MSAVLRLFSAVPAWGWLLLALGVWGMNNARQATNARAELAQYRAEVVQEQLRESEAARVFELAINQRTQEISDALFTAQKQRDAAARTAAQRLRDLAEARQHSAETEAALASCRAYEGAPARVIPDATRDALVELARDADEVSDRLKACQAFVLLHTVTN